MFGERLIQYDIDGGYYDLIKPTNAVTGSNVVEFTAKGSSDFIDPQHCALILRVRIVNDDGTPLAAGAEIAPINYPLSTIFKHLEVYLDNDLVSNDAEYGYKSYMETMATYGKDAKKSWLQLGGYFKDSPNNHNALLTVDNAGYGHRKQMFANSRVVELIGRIHSGLFSQERLIMSLVNLRLVFSLNKHQFIVMGAAGSTQRLEIVDAELMVRRSSPSSATAAGIISSHQKNDIHYFVPRVDVKTFTFTNGLNNIGIRHSIAGKTLPTRVMIGLVSNTSFNGSYAENPLLFHHYNISSVDITVDSKSLYGKTLMLTPVEGQCARAQWLHLSTLGFTGRNDGNGISRSDYLGGFFTLSADLQPSLPNGDYDDPAQSGNMEISMNFSVPLPHTITVILYMEFNGVITLNSARRAVANGL